jgi:hypothetical protein
LSAIFSSPILAGFYLFFAFSIPAHHPTGAIRLPVVNAGLAEYESNVRAVNSPAVLA